MRKRVLVIGIDGGTWDIINSLLSSLPNIDRLVKNGFSGNLVSTVPCVTAPAWNSAFTGVNPGKHGMFDFVKYGENHKPTPVDSTQIKYPLIWDMLTSKNMKSIIISVPMTYPTKKINGIMVSGFGSPGEDSDFTYPPELKKEISRKIPGFRFNTKAVYNQNPEGYQKEILEITDMHIKLTKLLLTENPDWDLAVTVFSATDWAQHHYWDKKDRIAEIYSKIDSFLGWVFENLINEDTHLILMSDHGFEKKGKIFHINRYFEEKGYLKTKSGGAKNLLASLGLTKTKLLSLDVFNLRRFIPLGIRESVPMQKKDTAKIDFTDFKAWYPSTAGHGVIVKDDETRDMVISDLAALRDPETGEKILRGVFKKEEIYWGPHISDAYDIVLDANKNYDVVSDYHAKWLRETSASDRKAWHNMKGMYVFYGKDINHGKKNLMIWDIAPAILFMLGLPLYKDMDGQVYKELFSGELAKRDIKFIFNLRNVLKW